MQMMMKSMHLVIPKLKYSYFTFYSFNFLPQNGQYEIGSE